MYHFFFPLTVLLRYNSYPLQLTAGVEDGRVDGVGEMNGKIVTDTCRLPCVPMPHVASGHLLFSTGSSVFCDDLEGGDGVGGGRLKREGYTQTSS